MRLSPSELETIRKRPQSTRLNLFIYEPQEVLRCTLRNPRASKGDVSIYFTGLTAGSYTIEEGMTLLVGNTSGNDDVGRIRIKSASITGTSGTFTVSENSHINWKNSQRLTVLDYVEVMPVFPRIIQNPSNKTDVIFYKDYDISYTNQNTILGTFVNMGSHRAGLLEGGSTQLYWSASGTYNLLGFHESAGLTYAWEFGGGSPSTSSSQTPGNVTYSSPGDYVTKLTVTASNGAEDVSYRYVSIRDKIGQGDNPPILQWEMSNFAGSRAEGGYSAEFTVHDLLDIKGNAIVMLKSDDWYGNTNTSLGGNGVNQSDMFFVGYVDRDSIRYDYKKSQVSFTAVSVTSIMKQGLGFSVSVESRENPTTWYELYDMDCRRAIYHYLRWHSTVLKIADFQFVGEDYKIQFFDADRTSMFDAIDNLMRGTLVGNVCSDRQGKIWAEKEPMVYNNPTGTFLPVMDITRRDWMNEPTVTENLSNNISYMEYGGIYYKGSSVNLFKPLLSCAPGVTPSYRGEIDKQQGLALKSQRHLNTLIGHIYANRNSEFPEIQEDMSVGLRNLDIAPFEVVDIDIKAEDTNRNKRIKGLYIPDTMSWNYNHKDGLLLPSITFRSLVNGFPGDTIVIPPASENKGSPVFHPPKIPVPVAIPPVLPPDYPASGTDPSVVVLGTTNYGVVYTENFDEFAPVWVQMNEGLSEAVYNTTTRATSIGQIVKAGNESLFLMGNGGISSGWNEIYYAESVGSTWTLIAESSATDIFRGMGVNPSEPEQIAVLGGLSNLGGTWRGRFYLGDSGGLTFTQSLFLKSSYNAGVVKTVDGWDVYTLRADGLQGILSVQSLWKLDDNGIMLDSGIIGAQGAYNLSLPAAIGNLNPFFASSAYLSNKSFYWRNATTSGYGIFEGTTETIYTDIKATAFQSISPSPDGTRAVSSDIAGGLHRIYRSADGGITWESNDSLIPLGMSVVENCQDTQRWIIGGGTNMKYTSNFFDSGNENKEGNFSPDFPLIDVIIIRYVK